MKNPIRYTAALLTACAVLPAAGLFAQAPAVAPAAPTVAPATPSVSVPAGTATAEGEEHEGGMMKALEKLTPEEKQKLKAAHKAALADPSVKAAEAQKDGGKGGKRAYHEAVHAAMLKADPSIQPILDKMKEERKENHLSKKDLK